VRPEPGTFAYRAALAVIILAMMAASIYAAFDAQAGRAAAGIYRFVCG